MVKYIILFVINATQLFGQNNSATLHVHIRGEIRMGTKKMFVENVGYGIIDSITFYRPDFDIEISKRPNACYRLCYQESKTSIFFIDDVDNLNVRITLENDNITYTNITEGGYNQLFYASKDSILHLNFLKGQTDNRLVENLKDDLIYDYFSNTYKGNPFLGMVLLYDFRAGLKWVNPRTENIKKYLALIDVFNKQLNKHPLINDIKYTLDSLERLTKGGNIYDFSLRTIRKEFISTFDKRGKFLLILFAARSCYAAIDVENELIEHYKELKDLNFEVLRVSLDFHAFQYDYRLLQNIDGIYDYPWESVYLFNDRIGYKIRRNYNILSWPRSFLYSPDGILIEPNPSIESLFNHLKANKK